MVLVQSAHESEGRSQLREESLRRITNDIQAAALHRAVRRERGDEHMTSWLDASLNLLHIALSILLVGQEVKYGPVVPDVEGRRGQCDSEDIADDPAHVGATLPETGLRGPESRLRYIQNGDVRSRAIEKAIDEVV